MNKKPVLTVIGGCNGSGKSTFSLEITSGKPVSFDYDKVFKTHYDSLIPSDIQERMAHNLARETLEFEVERAIRSNLDFAYETNFNSTPLFWPRNSKALDITSAWFSSV